MAGTQGKSGRKNKPTFLKIVTGNPGRRELNRNEPQPSPGALVVPDWLDDEGKEKWAEIVKLCPWITTADADTLALYADAFSHYRKAQRLSIRTPVIKGSDGKISKNPAWTARNEAFQQLRSAGSELGLSPSSRSGINVGKRETSDLAKEYFGF